MFNRNEQMQAGAILNKLKLDLERHLKGEQCVFLLVGRTGYGKSSLVNKLLGKPIAPVGDKDPTTMDIIPYEAEIEGVKFKVIDTPGLCDDLEEEGNDYEYLELMRRRVNKVDLMWFVSRLDETRVSGDDKRAIKLITKSFTPKIWQNAIIVFTFADRFNNASEYLNQLKIRTQSIQQEIQKRINEEIQGQTADQIASTIPSVAVSNICDTTPDKKEWMGELYAVVLERMSKNGAAKFFMATVNRIKPPEKEKEIVYLPSPSTPVNNDTISLDERQYERVRNRTKEIFELTSLGVGIGTALGALGGPAGAVAGGAVGAGLGFIISMLRE